MVKKSQLKSIIKEHQITTRYSTLVCCRVLKSIIKEHQITTVDESAADDAD